MGGKANCLCLRGIWETPKPRYREETKPVVKLPGTTFRAKDSACHARSWGRDTAARRPRGRAPSEETHLRREARASFARCPWPRDACSVTFAVCAKWSSVLEPTGTQSPRS